MSRIELPDGQWAELLDPKKVNERKRRAYISAMSEYQKSKAGIADASGFGAEQQDLLDKAFDLLIVCLVSSWSFEQPVGVEALADFGTDVFDPLKSACLKVAKDVLPDYSPSPDPTAGGEKSSEPPADLPTAPA
jgi:hypothetical protein